jgi:hypothetical protein
MQILVWGSAAGVTAVIVLVLALLSVRGPTGPRHVLSAPGTIGTYVRRPQLEQQMNARQLQQQVMSRSAGQASHVLSAVYENRAGVAGTSPPQILLFIGGHLAGTSAADFISSFRSQFQGAMTTGAGPLGGQAACVSARSGVVAVCAWADNDTFGVLASPTMHAAQLGAQLRAIRPDLEHVAR